MNNGLFRFVYRLKTVFADFREIPPGLPFPEGGFHPSLAKRGKGRFSETLEVDIKTLKVFRSIALFLAVLLSGCGYAVHKQAELPFTSIAIDKIENKTHEPKLQDRLQRALTLEFLKQGFTIDPASEYRLSGTITNYQMQVIATKDNFATDYNIIVHVDFRLLDKKGKNHEFKNIRNTTAMNGSGTLSALSASKEAADDAVMANISSLAAGAVIYKKYQ